MRYGPILRGRLPVMVMIGCLSGVCSCGPKGPKFHEVNGKIELADGDVRVLAGSTIEAALESDNTVRASGEIQADGSFTLESLHEGVIKKGAQEGTYQVRIILGDDDKQLHRQAAKALNERFLKFQTSNLTFQVPANGTVTLKMSAQ